MSAGTGIQWTEATWNPVAGCTRVSAGCDKCYAVTMTHRLEAMGQEKYAGLTVLNGRGDRHFNGTVRCVEDALKIPLRWKKPRRVFVNSMSDLFHKDVPFEFIDRVFAVMALCPQHTFQVLTKRPDRMAEYLNTPVRNSIVASFQSHNFSQLRKKPCEPLQHVWPLPNVWLGTSCENQAAADERIPHLLRCPAAVRFISAEPLLGPIVFDNGWHVRTVPWTEVGQAIHWVICGGESGKGARPCDVSWIRSIVQQCAAANVPCFVKQLGKDVRWDGVQGGYMKGPSNIWPDATKKIDVNRGWRMMLGDHKGGDPSEWPEDLRVRQFPEARQ